MARACPASLVACRLCAADRRASNSVGRNSEPRRDTLGRYPRSSGNRSSLALEVVAGGQPSASVPPPAVRAACRAGRNGISSHVSKISRRRPHKIILYRPPQMAHRNSPIVRVLFAGGGMRHRPDPLRSRSPIPRLVSSNSGLAGRLFSRCAGSHGAVSPPPRRF
jgi:hypothetical protein